LAVSQFICDFVLALVLLAKCYDSLRAVILSFGEKVSLLVAKVCVDCALEGVIGKDDIAERYLRAIAVGVDWSIK